MTGPVLIIEDDADISEILRYALEKEHYDIRVAFTGEQGLQASLDNLNPPSMILLDLLLPGMSGNELCRRLRAEPLTRNVPILVITATAFQTDANEILNVGADDVIFKPFSVSEVVSRVRSLTNRPIHG